MGSLTSRIGRRVVFDLVRNIFMVVFVIAVLATALVVIGGTLPDGNPLRDATQGMRDIGRSIADGFGGGYRPMTGG